MLQLMRQHWRKICRFSTQVFNDGVLNDFHLSYVETRCEKMSISIIPEIEDLQACLDFTAQHHLGWEFNDFMYPDILDNQAEMARLIEIYRSGGLPPTRSLHGAFLDIAVHSSDSRIRKVSDERVNESIDAANALACQKVIFHSNFISNYTTQLYLDNWVSKNVKYWTAKSKQYPDVDLLIENMFDMTPYLLQRLAEEMSEVPRFGICLDYAHAEVFGNGTNSCNGFVRSLAPYVRHIHLNDCDLRHDLHLTIGEGMLNWDQFAELYAECMSGASILIEINGLEQQKRSLDFLQELFARRGITL